ncbi:MAG: DUF4846 domain-containing protein [Tepidisphaerales bacterium]
MLRKQRGQGRLAEQGYVPAQEMHILKNLADPAISPWHAAVFGPHLKTPQWTFREPVRGRFGLWPGHRNSPVSAQYHCPEIHRS